jgi:CRP/FNR family transcriptional regulator, cyclic AMP receptor protein
VHKDAKVKLISKVPLFANCSKRELQQIASVADQIELPAGKVLMRKGDRGREFFVLLDGKADVQATDRTRTLKSGDFFGEIALVSDQPRTATVTTKTPVDALVITDRGFRDLMRRSPQIQLKVLQALADRLAPTVV